MPRTLRRRILRWGAILLGIYLLFCLVVYALQDKLIYMPLGAVEDDSAKNGMTFEDVTLTTSDGVKISAWYVPALRRPEPVEGADNATRTVLISHGNGGNLGFYVDMVRTFHKLGVNVLIYDYRGYGNSEGDPSEQGTYRDADAAWKYLVETRGTSPSQIVLFGWSLGGAVASHLAEANDASPSRPAQGGAAPRPAGLILQSSFTSLPDMAAKAYPLLPARALCKYRYDTVDRLGRIHCPVLVIHSPEDNIVPYAMGRKLFETARGPKQFLRIFGGHGEVFRRPQEEYVKGLDAFVKGLPLGGAH